MNMHKYLHCFFISILLFVLISPIIAQSDRILLSKKIENIKSNHDFEVVKQSNIPESKTKIILQKSGKAAAETATHTSSNFQVNTTEVKPNYSEERKSRDQIEHVINPAHPNTDNSSTIYLDLKVEATQEINNYPVKENNEIAPRKVEKQKNEIQKQTNTAKAVYNNTNSVIISPLKRKFLEDRMSYLETELQKMSDTTSLEYIKMQTELADLKKLLQ